MKRPSQQQIPRRAALGIIAGTLLSVGGLYYWSTEAQPVTQKDVDREYLHLYNYLQAEKEKAKGKRLVIIAGEVHSARNALLLEFMLLDIAKQLGIRHTVIETDQTVLSKMSQYADKVLERCQRDAAGFLQDYRQEVEQLAYPDFSRTAYLAYSFKAYHHSHRYNPDVTLNPPNLELALITGRSSGFQFHAGDPSCRIRRQYGINDPRLFDAQYEQPMADLLAGIAKDHDCIGIFGAGHAPVLYEEARKHGFHAVGLNFSANMPFSKTSRHMLSNRIKMLESFYTPEIRTTYQMSPAEAWAMVLRSSIMYQYTQSRRLSEQQAGFRIWVVDELAKAQPVQPSQQPAP